MFTLQGRNSNIIECCEPIDVAAALESDGLPTDILGKANSLRIQHGPKPNTGYFLIRYQDYLNLNLSGYPDVTIHITSNATNNNGPLHTESFQYMTCTNAINVLGPPNTPQSIVLIKLEDYRYWMRRIDCDQIANNFLATNNDFDSAGLRANTLNGGSLYSLSDILQALLLIFRTRANDSRFNAATYSGDSTYTSDLPYNVEFVGKSILDALMELCSAYRLNMHVQPNGVIKFSSSLATWPTFDEDPIAVTIDSGPTVIPTTLKCGAADQTYELYDDRCDNDHPASLHTRDYSPSSPTVTSTTHINVPYTMLSGVVANTSVVNATLDSVAARFETLLSTSSRVTYWRDYRPVHDSLDFGLDAVEYSNRGTGFYTSSFGFDYFNMPINYRDPKFINYFINPHGMWLYRFTLTTTWSALQATADIFRFDGSSTNYTATVRDPFAIFEDLGIGDSGWCIELCGNYYAIQAPCVTEVLTPSSSSSSIIPE